MAIKRWWQPECGFFLAIWFILLLTGRSSLLRDPGTFWHTVVGQRVLSTGELVNSDHFSFTFAGQPWTPQQWLSEILMAMVHDVAGLDGLVLITVSLLAGLYAWIAGRLLRSGLHWLPAALLVALTIAASSYHFHARPHVISIVLVGWTCARLADFENRRITFRGLIGLVPVYALWVNLHGGVLAGIALAALAVIGWTCWWLLRQPSPISGWSDRLKLLGLLVVLGLTPLLNPYGLELPLGWRTIMTADLPRFIEEHAPLNFADADGKTVLLLAGLYGFVLIGTLPRWPRVAWLLPLVLLYLALGRVRHGPLFATAAVLAIADMLPYTRWVAWLSRRGSQLVTLPQTAQALALRWHWMAVASGVVLLALGLQHLRIPVPVMGHGWAHLDSSRWPVELLPQLREHESDSPGRIFNELTFGGFLTYHTPGYRIFIDDRCELYGDEFLLAYDEAARERPEQIEEWQRAYDFRLALTRTGSRFDEHLRNAARWQVLAECPAATLHRLKE